MSADLSSNQDYSCLEWLSWPEWSLILKSSYYHFLLRLSDCKSEYLIRKLLTSIFQQLTLSASEVYFGGWSPRYVKAATLRIVPSPRLLIRYSCSGRSDLDEFSIW